MSNNDDLRKLPTSVPLIGRTGPTQQVPIRMTETDMKQRFLKFVNFNNGKNIYVRMYDFIMCEFLDNDKGIVYTTTSIIHINSTKLPIELSTWKVEG